MTRSPVWFAPACSRAVLSTCAAFSLIATFSASTIACGRSDPNAGACPAREGLVCSELATLRTGQEKTYADAVKNSDGNGAAAAGACNQSLVDLEVQRQCIADRCTELCGLSPCAIVGGADCATTCSGLGVNNDALDIALIRAARSPGFCSCGVCIGEDGKPANDGTQKLCTDLFVCQ